MPESGTFGSVRGACRETGIPTAIRPNDRCQGPLKLQSQYGSEWKVVPSGAGGWLTIQSEPRSSKNAAEGCGQAISPLRLSRAFFTACTACTKATSGIP